MSESTIWWLLAGAAVALELATGTFFLLMIAVGFVAGAIFAHLGLALVGQMVIAAVVGGGAVAAWHWHRPPRPTGMSIWTLASRFMWSNGMQTAPPPSNFAGPTGPRWPPILPSLQAPEAFASRKCWATAWS